MGRRTTLRRVPHQKRLWPRCLASCAAASRHLLQTRFRQPNQRCYHILSYLGTIVDGESPSSSSMPGVTGGKHTEDRRHALAIPSLED